MTFLKKSGALVCAGVFVVGYYCGLEALRAFVGQPYAPIVTGLVFLVSMAALCTIEARINPAKK